MPSTKFNPGYRWFPGPQRRALWAASKVLEYRPNGVVPLRPLIVELHPRRCRCRCRRQVLQWLQRVGRIRRPVQPPNCRWPVPTSVSKERPVDLTLVPLACARLMIISASSKPAPDREPPGSLRLKRPVADDPVPQPREPCGLNRHRRHACVIAADRKAALVSAPWPAGDRRGMRAVVRDRSPSQASPPPAHVERHPAARVDGCQPAAIGHASPAIGALVRRPEYIASGTVTATGVGAGGVGRHCILHVPLSPSSAPAAAAAGRQTEGKGRDRRDRRQFSVHRHPSRLSSF